MTPEEALEILRQHGIDKANESYGAEAVAIDAEVNATYELVKQALYTRP